MRLVFLRYVIIFVRIDYSNALNWFRFLLLAQCDLTPEQWAKLHEKIVECGAKEGASDADVQELLERKQPSTHLGKCTVACVMETGGMVRPTDIH